MLPSSSLSLIPCLLLATLACGETHGAPSAVETDSGAGGTLPATGGSAGGGSPPLAGGGARQQSAGSGGALLGQGGAGGTAGGTWAGGASGADGSSTGGVAGARVSLLVFSRTAAYRHDSIPAGVQALGKLSADRGWQFAATEDPSQFSDAGLAAYDAVIFLSTTGDVLDDLQQAAFERFIRAGKGFIGIHSATDTEYDWPWYGGLVGAYFREHPPVQAADLVVEDSASPITAGLPNPWLRTDEWYAFQSNPRPNVHVLLSLDETSYAPGSANMDGDHPVAWCHEYDGGRAFYTALGHTSESYAEPLFMEQLAAAVGWVMAR